MADDSEPESLDSYERRDAQQRAAPSAGVVFEAIRREGEAELRRPPANLAWSGLAAGLSMGFSFVAEALLHAHTPDHAWRAMITAFGYSIGFLVVILGRQQLFTENTLTPVLELLRFRSWSMLGRTAKLWAIVLFANLVGTAIFAFVVARTELFDAPIHQAFGFIAAEHYEAAFHITVLRGIFAGWLIALMLWLLPFAETGRVAVIVIIAYLIGLGGFSHIIAGSVSAQYAVFMGTESVGAFLLRFFLPTLLGNIVGGVSLVAAINYAQVAASSGRRRTP